MSQAPSVTSGFASGGTVTVAVPYLPTNFNPSTPAGANRVTQMVMEQVWPQAFVIDPEYQAETTGFIDSAEVVGLSPMTVSYVIDPKATWSDGYPITATDFEYNWQQQLQASPVLASPGFPRRLPRHQVDLGQQRRQDRESRVQQSVLGLGGALCQSHTRSYSGASRMGFRVRRVPP